MKRFFGIATLLACAVTSSAMAESLADRVSLKGHALTRGEANRYTDFATNRGSAFIRVRPNVTIKAMSNLSVVLEPQASKVFGSPVYNPTGTAANTFQQTSSQTFDTNLLVHQAYIDYQPWDEFGFTVGRMVLDYGDGLVIGALDWHNISRAFDGARLRYNHHLLQGGNVDFFAAKLMDLNVSNDFAGGDATFWGLYSTTKVTDYLQAMDLYLLWLSDKTPSPQFNPANGTGRIGFWTVGARFKGEHSRVDYRFEVDKQWGNVQGVNTTSVVGSSSPHQTSGAYQADVEVGYTLDHELKPRAAGEFFIADKNYNQLFPTVHKWLGYADVFGRRNIMGVAAHVSALVWEKLTPKFDYHYFRRTQRDNAPAYTLNGGTLGDPTRSMDSDLGHEFDLTLDYKVSDRLNFTGGWSVFLPTGYLKELYQDDKLPYFYFVSMNVKF